MSCDYEELGVFRSQEFNGESTVVLSSTAHHEKAVSN